LFESAVMLNKPGEGVMVDLTLDRGRVEVDGSNAPAGARIRVRFLRQVWDVVLIEKGSKVCVELLQTPKRLAGGEAVRCFGLFSRGKVKVKTGREELTFSSPARVAWSNAQPEAPPFEEKLAKPPRWWDEPPPATAEVKDAVLSLADWAKRLDQAQDVVDTIVTVVRDSRDRTERVLGVWFLAALDEVSHLPEFLGDKEANQGEVRNAALYALRDWLARSGARRAALTQLIRQQRGYAPADAALIVSLLSPLSDRAREDPATYQKWIELLDHDKLEVRHLAAKQLSDELPEEALKIGYDPTDEPGKRRKAVARWQALVPAGKVPARRAVKRSP
jgi:hypothetical protein